MMVIYILIFGVLSFILGFRVGQYCTTAITYKVLKKYMSPAEHNRFLDAMRKTIEEEK